MNLPLAVRAALSFLTGQAAHNHGIRTQQSARRRRLGAFLRARRQTRFRLASSRRLQDRADPEYLNHYGQQGLYGAWLAWLGGLIGVEFKGNVTIGNPREWVPPGWNLWYAFSGTRPKYYDYSINDNGKMLILATP